MTRRGTGTAAAQLLAFVTVSVVAFCSAKANVPPGSTLDAVSTHSGPAVVDAKRWESSGSAAQQLLMLARRQADDDTNQGGVDGNTDVANLRFGEQCSSDGDCASSICRTHCCLKRTAAQCEACGTNGRCYPSLSFKESQPWSAWQPTSMADGWNQYYHQYVKEDLDGPPPKFVSKYVDLKALPQHVTEACEAERGNKNQMSNLPTDAPKSMCRLSYRILWGAAGEDTFRTSENVYARKPAKVGSWGAKCRCADGQVYEVGDLNNNCKSVACFGDGELISECRNNAIAKTNAGMAVFCGPNTTSADENTVLAGSSLDGYINTDECPFAYDGVCDLNLCATGSDCTDCGTCPHLFKSQRPPVGLTSAGEGNDPGNIDIDPYYGDISAIPRRTGFYTMWLILQDQGGNAKEVGLSTIHDQLVVKKWEFQVRGKDPFEITALERLPPSVVAAASTVWSKSPDLKSPVERLINVTVGIRTSIPGFNTSAAAFRFEHASGRDGGRAGITFTIRNAPSGFFVKPQNGEVLGYPRSSDVNVSTNQITQLVAIEASGDEFIVEKFKFNVVPAPTFVPIFSCSDRNPVAAEYADQYINPSPGIRIDYVVGEPVRIAAKLLIRHSEQNDGCAASDDGDRLAINGEAAQTTTQVSAGTVDDIVYSLSSGAPDLFFVNSASGEIVGEFAEAGNYSFSLIATDGGGKNATAEAMAFVVGLRRRFAVGVSSTRAAVSSQPGFVDPTIGSHAWMIGSTYKIAPFELEEANTSVSSGSFEDISYTLSENAPPSFFVQSESGIVFGEFEASDVDKKYNFSLLAVDKGGERATVETYAFGVAPRVLFEASGIRDGSSQPEYEGYTFKDNYKDNVEYTVDETYRLAPFDKRTMLLNGTQDDNTTISFSVNGAPTGLLIDVNTGYIQAVFTETDRVYNITVWAVDSSNFKALLETIEVRVVSTRGISQHTLVAMLLGVSASSLTLLLAIAIYRRVTKYLKRMAPVDFMAQFDKMVAAGEISPEQVGKSQAPREIRRSAFTCLKQIGSGAFGEVWKGILNESSTNSDAVEQVVAAKMVAEPDGSFDSSAAEGDLLCEATIMVQLPAHTNVIAIIGVITSGYPKIVVMQYCEHGSLHQALKKRAATGHPFSYSSKIRMSTEIANGMSHIAKHSFIHRDLAARNILLGAGKSITGMVCKVSDFGLSRSGNSASNNNDEPEGEHETYYRSQTGVFPVRWSAPEAIDSLKFNSKSDCWSFGIVVVELLVDGELPYKGKLNSEVLSTVRAGGRHPMPMQCTLSLYAILLECWDADPNRRPTFSTLVELLTTQHHDAIQTVDAAGRPGRSVSSGCSGHAPRRRVPALHVSASRGDIEAVAANVHAESSFRDDLGNIVSMPITPAIFSSNSGDGPAARFGELNSGMDTMDNVGVEVAANYAAFDSSRASSASWADADGSSVDGSNKGKFYSSMVKRGPQISNNSSPSPPRAFSTSSDGGSISFSTSYSDAIDEMQLHRPSIGAMARTATSPATLDIADAAAEHDYVVANAPPPNGTRRTVNGLHVPLPLPPIVLHSIAEATNGINGAGSVTSTSTGTPSPGNESESPNLFTSIV